MAERTIKTVKYGNTERKSFAQIHEVIDMPYLIEVQKASYEEFLRNGIDEVFKDFSPITDFSNRIELHFLGHRLEDKPKYTEKECKDRDATYAAPLKVNVRQIKTETGEVIEQEVYMGDFPLMTPNGSFIINGAERVVVSQLVRSPGVYFNFTPDHKTGTPHYNATNIPSRGAWLECARCRLLCSCVLWRRLRATKSSARTKSAVGLRPITPWLRTRRYSSSSTTSL